MVNVAVLLPGRLVSYSHGYLHQRFVGPAPPTIHIDTFVCSWRKGGVDGSLDVEEAKLLKSYQPTRVRVVDTSAMIEDPLTSDGTTGSLNSLGENQFFMLKQCFMLLKEHREATGRSYDYVIRGRLDIEVSGFPWSRLLPFVDRDQVVPNFRRLSNEILYFAGEHEHENCVWISDQFAISSPENMKVYCTLYDTYRSSYSEPLMRRIAKMCQSCHPKPNPRGFWFGQQNQMFLTHCLHRNQVVSVKLDGVGVEIHRTALDVHNFLDRQNPAPPRETRPPELSPHLSVRHPELWVYSSGPPPTVRTSIRKIRALIRSLLVELRSMVRQLISRR